MSLENMDTASKRMLVMVSSGVMLIFSLGSLSGWVDLSHHTNHHQGRAIVGMVIAALVVVACGMGLYGSYKRSPEHLKYYVWLLVVLLIGSLAQVVLDIFNKGDLNLFIWDLIYVIFIVFLLSITQNLRGRDLSYIQILP
eukprot:gb/GEZN01026564.1/.p1 GENE.gb/GEZN01026564.1/~~gb/GEZN01026564.1/.p1  ORF type:complete len:149 (+),score=12.19 gb/GEZN01026564.1/:30-449(+)